MILCTNFGFKLEFQHAATLKLLGRVYRLTYKLQIQCRDIYIIHFNVGKDIKTSNVT